MQALWQKPSGFTEVLTKICKACSEALQCSCFQQAFHALTMHGGWPSKPKQFKPQETMHASESSCCSFAATPGSPTRKVDGPSASRSLLSLGTPASSLHGHFSLRKGEALCRSHADVQLVLCHTSAQSNPDALANLAFATEHAVQHCRLQSCKEAGLLTHLSWPCLQVLASLWLLFS